jgi:hypothetical protein
MPLKRIATLTGLVVASSFVTAISEEPPAKLCSKIQALLDEYEFDRDKEVFEILRSVSDSGKSAVCPASVIFRNKYGGSVSEGMQVPDRAFQGTVTIDELWYKELVDSFKESHRVSPEDVATGIPKLENERLTPTE